jgi:hypothetical protein
MDEPAASVDNNIERIEQNRLRGCAVVLELVKRDPSVVV